MTLRQRLILVLAVLGAATVVANGFSFYMYSSLGADLLKIEPRLAASLHDSKLLIVAVIAIASAVGLSAFVLLVRILLGLLGGEPQYAADVVRRIATGDLAFTVNLRPGDNESLLAGISGMQQKLRDMVAQLHTASAQLGQTAAQFVGTTGEIRASTEAQSEAASGSAAAVEQMSVSIKSVADSAAEVDRQSAESLAGTQDGNESLSRMIGEIGEVEQAVNEIASTVGAFIESTQAIKRMTREVRDIADQTNLLALNAAIEAARAGEQGRGFAVVAQEVKSLAEQTTRATSDVAEQIAQIQRASQEANACIEMMAEATHEVSDIAASIAAQVENQGEATREIARNVQDASKRTKELAQVIEEVRAASRQSGGSAEEVLNAVTDLSQQTESLRRECDTFLARVRAA